MRLDRKNINVGQLTKEISEAIGKDIRLGILRPPGANAPINLTVIEANGDEVQVDESVVREVYLKHTAAPKTNPLRQQIENARTIEDLKKILLDALVPSDPF